MVSPQTTGPKTAYQTLERVVIDPQIMGGVPCIRDLGIRVSTLVHMTVEGMSFEEIIDQFPLLEPEDIDQGLEYAARAIRQFLRLPLSKAQTFR